MLKEKIKESESALTEKQCKWENRMFSKSGKVYFTGNFFDTQAQAENAVQIDLANLKTGGKCLLVFPQGNIGLPDYSWHMQIPIFATL